MLWAMEPNRTYTWAEMMAYKPPPCPTCGSPQRMEWTEVTEFGDETTYMHGPPDCRNDDCFSKNAG